jgi:hypothetical protein
MNTINLILLVTQTSAILEIILLLVIAGLIGYLTSYFYYKSVYTAKINILEGDIADLISKNDALSAEKNLLEKELKEKDLEIASLKKPGKG